MAFGTLRAVLGLAWCIHHLATKSRTPKTRNTSNRDKPQGQPHRERLPKPLPGTIVCKILRVMCSTKTRVHNKVLPPPCTRDPPTQPLPQHHLAAWHSCGSLILPPKYAPRVAACSNSNNTLAGPVPPLPSERRWIYVRLSQPARKVFSKTGLVWPLFFRSRLT